MDDRTQKLAYFLLMLNVILVMLGALAYAWQPTSRAGTTSTPYRLVQAIPAS